MLAEGLIHLRFMSPYTLFFINKKQGLCAEGRFTHSIFTVCIMQCAEVFRQKVLKQRKNFLKKKLTCEFCFQTTSEKLTELQKICFLGRVSSDGLSWIVHTWLWFLFIRESLTHNNLTFHCLFFQETLWSLPKAQVALLFVQKLDSTSTSTSAFHIYFFLAVLKIF